MTRHWESGVAYGTGEVVEYQGQKYKIIQGHTSQSDWIPGISTAALYQHLGSEEHREPPQQCQASRGVYEHPQVPAQNTNVSSNPNSLERWLEDARRRADEFRRSGPRAPTTWVLVKGHEIPGGAIEAGKEGDNVLYVARAYVEDGIYVGKAGKHLRQGAEIGRQHKSHAFNEYEILVGDSRAVRWVETRGVRTLKTWVLATWRLAWTRPGAKSSSPRSAITVVSIPREPAAVHLARTLFMATES